MRGTYTDTRRKTSSLDATRDTLPAQCDPCKVDVAKKTCEVAGCTTIPCFWDKQGAKPRFRCIHNVTDLPNVRNKQCAVTGCGVTSE